jgi:hypothetical protein
MATKIVTTDVPGNVKPSFATSSLVGLTVRANGEEATKVLDMNGNIVNAQMPTPTNPPTLSSTGTGTGMVSQDGKVAVYVYVWAATQRYPLVENDQSFGGSLAPRGMASPGASTVIGGGGNGVHIVADAPPADRPDLDQVWIFRTVFFSDPTEASENANAGNLYFVAAVDAPAGSGTVTYDDENPLEGTDQIEVDNFGVPTFRYVMYSDPFWWGWGNFPLSVDGSWVGVTGIITLTDGTKWYNGRNGHYVRLEGVEDGGIGNNGLWLFKWIDATHAQLTLADGSNSTVASDRTGKIVIQGPSTTLFRSKPRNPFSWGFTEILADGSRIPQIYAFKIGGGLGTAIAQVPTVPYLLLSTEYPAGTFTLDLRQAGSTAFENTLRQISNFYSITSHFSQFTATRQFFPISGSQMRQEKIVLWGWDAKNFCIVETDGIGINVVSEKVSKTLRRMSKDRSRQILAHGAYDARNRMNCMWLPSDDSYSQIDLLIMHHAPTDQWFIHDEKDLLCTAQFQDGDTNLSKIYGGTETGLMGEMFADGFFSNWVSSGRSLGTITEFTDNSVTRDDGVQFYLDRDGYIGNWALITDENGENEQWGRISDVDEWTLTFDVIRQASGTYGASFNPPITPNSIFYVGVIECRALKYFDMAAPAEDKKLSEIWATLDQVNLSRIQGHVGSSFLRYYRERTAVPFSPLNSGRLCIPIQRVKLDDDADTQVWFTQEPPTERIKAFGLEIIDRSFNQWRFYNWTLKVN